MTFSDLNPREKRIAILLELVDALVDARGVTVGEPLKDDGAEECA